MLCHPVMGAFRGVSSGLTVDLAWVRTFVGVWGVLVITAEQIIF